MRRLGFWILSCFVLAAPVNAADVFVWSGATGANNGTSWGDAFTSIARDFGADLADECTEFVYVRSIHAESIGTSVTITGETAEGASCPVRILSVAGAATGTTPGALTAGASLTTTGGTADITVNEAIYIYGVNFHSTDLITFGASESQITLENSDLSLDTSGGLHFIFVVSNNTDVSSKATWLNVDVTFTNTSSYIGARQGHFTWRGGVVTGNQAYLFNNNLRGVDITLQDLDLSAITSGTIFNAAYDAPVRATVNRVKIGATAAVLTGTIDTPGTIIDAYYVQTGTSAAPALNSEFYRYAGSIKTQTVRTRGGGQTDGTTAFSWLMSSDDGSLTTFYQPLESPPLGFWLDGDGATAHVVRFYFASGASQTNATFWPVCETQTSADTSVLGEITSGRMAPLGTPAAWTTDATSTWTCSSDCTTQQYADVTITPDKPGLARCWFYLGADAEQVHVDPYPDIDP